MRVMASETQTAWLFVQLIQANDKENIKDLNYWPLVGVIPGLGPTKSILG